MSPFQNIVYLFISGACGGQRKAVEVISLLLPSESEGLHSGCKAEGQEPLPTEPSLLTPPLIPFMISTILIQKIKDQSVRLQKNKVLTNT